MKDTGKFMGFFFILLNTFILIYTIYAYRLFDKMDLSNIDDNQKRLGVYLKEEDGLFTIIYIAIFVAGLLLIKDINQKILASLIIITSYVLYNFISPYASP